MRRLGLVGPTDLQSCFVHCEKHTSPNGSVGSMLSKKWACTIRPLWCRSGLSEIGFSFFALTYMYDL